MQTGAALVLPVARRDISRCFQEACLCRSEHKFSTALGRACALLTTPHLASERAEPGCNSVKHFIELKSKHASPISRRYMLRTILSQIGPLYSTECLPIMENVSCPCMALSDNDRCRYKVYTEVRRTCQVLVNMEPYLERGETCRVGRVCMRRAYR